MINISRESEINLINILIDQDIISGKDLANIKKVSTESQTSQLDAVFKLNLTDEEKILDLLVKEQSLEVVDAHPERFVVEVLTANNNSDLLIKQAKKYSPNVVVITNESCVQKQTYSSAMGNNDNFKPLDATIHDNGTIWIANSSKGLTFIDNLDYAQHRTITSPPYSSVFDLDYSDHGIDVFSGSNICFKH